MLICPVRIQLKSTLKFKEAHINGFAHLMLGYRKRGVGINIYPEKAISFGTYHKPIYVKTLRDQSQETHEKKQTKDKKSIKEKYQFFRKIPVMQLTKSIIRSTRWEEFSLKGKLGLSNPMQTGMVFGFMNSFKGLARPQKFILALEPVFSQKMNTDVEGTMHVRFSPLVTIIQVGFTYLKFRK